MSEPSWNKTRQFVHQRANGCCEYCQTCEINIGQTMHVEHIDPEGGDAVENLCLACPNCNFSKSVATTAVDPISETVVSLFNPRSQKWRDHFKWEAGYTRIKGLTPIGRATVERLKMNRPRIVLTRQRWVNAGLHPVES